MMLDDKNETIETLKENLLSAQSALKDQETLVKQM
jgi:hypothetical protein